jgi:hypothetical protein
VIAQDTLLLRRPLTSHCPAKVQADVNDAFEPHSRLRYWTILHLHSVRFQLKYHLIFRLFFYLRASLFYKSNLVVARKTLLLER